MLRRTSGLLVSLAAGAIGLTAQQPAPSSTADPMYAAIRSGETATVASLLQAGAEVNGKERRGGATPLMHAAAVGSVETMRTLLERGADVNARSAANASALMWAVADIAKVRLLVERGADVNAASESGRTPLLLAALSDDSADTVRFLLSKGANPKAVDSTRMTTLWAATFGDDTATIRQLVEAGADVDAAETILGRRR